MKKKTKYSDEKIGKVKVVKDFLPKPEHLILKEDTVKVTLNLSKSSIEFFEEVARRRDHNGRNGRVRSNEN